MKTKIIRLKHQEIEYLYYLCSISKKPDYGLMDKLLIVLNTKLVKFKGK